MHNKYWLRFFGFLLICWGVFSFFNQKYYDMKFGYFVDLGTMHREYGIIAFIIGLVLIGISLRRWK